MTGYAIELRVSQGILQPPALDPPGRLARDVDLVNNGLTFSGRPGRRTVFGARSGIRHALAQDRASITFGSQSDLVRHWIVAIRLKVDRDWTWDGLQALEIYRDGNPVGTMEARAFGHDTIGRLGRSTPSASRTNSFRGEFYSVGVHPASMANSSLSAFGSELCSSTVKKSMRYYLVAARRKRSRTRRRPLPVQPESTSYGDQGPGWFDQRTWVFHEKRPAL